MTWKVWVKSGVSRLFPSGIYRVALLAFLPQILCAATCTVVKHNPATEAEKAFLAADYSKAAGLYQSELAKRPGDLALTAGLVHTLLRQQKVQEAGDVVRTSLATAPTSAALLTMRGEVELREGYPWIAGETANRSVKLDPCNPRTHLLLAELGQASSLFASARQQILVAHQLDPEDPEIRSDWIGTLPLKQRIPEIEDYLSSPTGDDADDLRRLRQYLDHEKKLAATQPKSCQLVSQTTSTEIPFSRIMYDPTHMIAFGLDVKLNNRKARLQIDTGAGGLVVSRPVANRAGLRPFSKTEMEGVGDKGPKSGYTAYADSIQIGGLEFQNCPVDVLDDRSVVDVDGLIGMDVFSRFLVTLNYPKQKLALSPLPPRPGEVSATTPQLNTDDDPDADEDTNPSPESAPNDSKDKAAGPGTAGGAKAPAASAKDAAHGPFDRYIAPEMKDYDRVYRSGHDLIVPAQLNGQKVRLFILDTGAWTTTISPEAAREVTKVHNDSSLDIRGVSGKVEKVYSANKITFRFANLEQKGEDVVAFDTSRISKDEGMEISGFLGATTLYLLTIHIDYRDGLVKFEYDPNRVPRF